MENLGVSQQIGWKLMFTLGMISIVYSIWSRPYWRASAVLKRRYGLPMREYSRSILFGWPAVIGITLGTVIANMKSRLRPVHIIGCSAAHLLQRRTHTDTSAQQGSPQPHETKPLQKLCVARSALCGAESLDLFIPYVSCSAVA